jgi:hypothetical protein
MLDYEAVVKLWVTSRLFLYKIDNVGLLVNTLKQGNVKKSRLYIFGNILFDIFRLFLCLRLLHFVN